MRCFVITGVSKRTIEELMKRVVKTIELRSAHNVTTALKVDVGDLVFLTPTRLHDIDRGTTGIIAEVVGKDVHTHSLIFASESIIQESEMTVVRLRLNVRGVGRIVKVHNTGILDTTEADVVEISYFDAR